MHEERVPSGGKGGGHCRVCEQEQLVTSMGGCMKTCNASWVPPGKASVVKINREFGSQFRGRELKLGQRVLYGNGHCREFWGHEQAVGGAAVEGSGAAVREALQVVAASRGGKVAPPEGGVVGEGAGGPRP
ncbi:hypothetical protein GOP47_0009733 [Adiantum capillus-veneris]|uniref:Uncharacterized protein n=1 Tax=Adiantum capillus-veneris TaxID=13818 RepID=A0A9D4UYC1_ADICA|nr:hypothetical protein GOP47_0009733 [Adiantum capillus-veneris]